jgi:hypothetical protein
VNIRANPLCFPCVYLGMSTRTYRNRVLASLSEDAVEQLQLVRVKLKAGSALYGPDTLDTHLTFPEDGVIGTSLPAGHGHAPDALITGCEGVLGLRALVGHSRLRELAIVRATGWGYQTTIHRAQTYFRADPIFQERMFEVAHDQFLQTCQMTSCALQHRGSQRLAKLLVMYRRRVQDDSLPITQEVLSAILGLRRTTVCLDMGRLENSGAIRTQRGMVHFKDMEILMMNACSCLGEHLLDAGDRYRHVELDPGPANESNPADAHSMSLSGTPDAADGRFHNVEFNV